MLKSEETLRKMNPQSNDIFTSGLIEHYSNRPRELGYNIRKNDKKNTDKEDVNDDEDENSEETDEFYKSKKLYFENELRQRY